MALTKQHFTKLWTDENDFPAVEHSEAQVRADMQELHNQMQNYINSVLTEELDDRLAERLSADGLSLSAVNDGAGSVTLTINADGDPVTSVRLNVGHAQNITNTYITNELYTDYGWIADIVVDWLRTDHCRAERFLQGDTSQLDFLNIHDEEIKCISATPVEEQTEQMCFNGVSYYWTDAEKTQMTTEPTQWPVMSYKYSELTKLAIKFESITLSNGATSVMPVIILGAGTGQGDAGKAFIYKDADGLRIKYCTSGGGTVSVALDDSGQLKKTVGEAVGVVEAAMNFGPMTVTGGTWTADTRWTAYPYAAVLSCPGVTEQMSGEVIFSPDAPLDKLCPAAVTGDGTVTVYAAESISGDVRVELVRAVF